MPRGAYGKAARARAASRPDLIRKEEIPPRRVHSVWDGEMLPLGDDRAPRD
ncbi:hypothetical protein GCM10023257_55300 [Streptomyces hyderabadensis]|uniref:Uncharacterized protein n=1 Tax=Streptomyces hyderabadensis TaxID=598549 RepID=A0ABP9IN90_9ACTN